MTHRRVTHVRVEDEVTGLTRIGKTLVPEGFQAFPSNPASQQSLASRLNDIADYLLMGLRMDDLHAPTVASGPTSAGYSNGVPANQLSLQELIAEKDRVEAELKALGQVLDSV